MVWPAALLRGRRWPVCRRAEGSGARAREEGFQVGEEPLGLLQPRPVARLADDDVVDVGGPDVFGDPRVGDVFRAELAAAGVEYLQGAGDELAGVGDRRRRRRRL